MSLEKCRAAVLAASGKESLDERELAALFREIDKRATAIKATMADGGDARLKAADDLAADVTLAVMLEKRAAAINAQRFIEAKDYLDTVWKDRRVEGIKALLVGDERARLGARLSVASQAHELTGRYLAGFTEDVVRLGDGHMALLASGKLDREISQALFAIDNPAAPPFKGPKEAQQIAEVIHKWQEYSRLQLNRSGAWVGKLAGYIARQSHDINKIKRAGKAEWIAKIRGKLDITRTVGSANEKDVMEFLSAAYDGLSTGVHLRTVEAPDGKMDGFKGFANLAKRASQERVLHFKDADAWFDYNTEFGTGNLRESVIRGLERSAQSTALMRTLGTNPQAMIQRLTKDQIAAAAGDNAQIAKLDNARKSIDNRLAEVDGRTRIPVSAMGAQISAGLRIWESMSKLGAAVITSFTDLPTSAAELKYQGDSFLSGIANGIGGLLRGRPKGERAQILSELSVFFDTMRNGVVNRFSAADTPVGTLSRLQGTFFKMNGMSWWTETLKASNALRMAHRAGLAVGKSWDQLQPELRRVYGLYGIDADKWDILRSVGAKEADGRMYLTPEGLDRLPDEPFAAYLRKRGQEPTPNRIATLRDEIASQYRTYISDRTDYAVLTPDARTRAMMRQGTQPGTVDGEMLRFIGQFKAFPIAFAQKVMGREFLGKGADTLSEGLRNGHGEVQSFAQLMVWMTVFGYGAMAVKDMLRGKEPRPPTDKGTILAAFLQGGGLGIYGDFLFGQSNRYGRSAAETFVGPVAGLMGDTLEVVHAFRDGDDAAAKLLKVGMSNTPFLNLFYTRAALDYAVLYRIQEWLSPGYLRRMEQRIKRENGQEFIVSPQEAAR